MQPVIIGLCGGIGSGKTTVARLFKKCGCGLIEADKIAHQVLSYNLVKKRLCQIFGQPIINKAGQIDPARLAQKAFYNRNNLRKLNTLTHRYIRQGIISQLNQQRTYHKIIVLDAALLLETSLYKICDFIIFVNASKTIRQLRIKKRRGWISSELVKRESFQLAPSIKKKKADFIIDNNYTLTGTYNQVQEIYRRIKYAATTKS